MNTQFIIDGIGDSMKHWANYIHDVKRGAIINESAIKFGISEYLVASEKFANKSSRNKNIGVPQIENIRFERTHDVFKNRRIDLSFNIAEGEDETEIFFEFKYLSDLHLPDRERDRYINDLFRLAALSKQNNKSKKCECYFMLVGNLEQVEQMIRKAHAEKNRNSIINNLNHPEINNCFSLQKNRTKRIVLKKLCDRDGNKHLERFENEYIYNDKIQRKLEDSDKMKISLKYKTPSSNEKVGVYIWQVEI